MSATVTQFPARSQPDPQGPEPGAYDGDRDELHSRLVRWFEEAEQASYNSRIASEIARDWYDGDQIDGPTMKALNDRHQPPLVDNLIRDKIELLCGMERKARTDPKAFPRTPTEEARADAATQVLRYIVDYNKFPAIRSAVYENMMVEGFGGADLGLEDDGKGGAETTITWAPWDRIWTDPHSRMKDFSDARYRGLVVWMDRDQCEDMYPNALETIGEAFSPTGSSYDDRPVAATWSDNRRERVRVAHCHWSEKGNVWSAHYTKAGFLTEPQRTKFRDSKGKPTPSLRLRAAYVNRQNEKYGVVKDLIPLNDAINKRLSKSLHLLSVSQVVADAGAVKDVDRARREVAKPDGYIEKTPGFEFEIHRGGDLAVGQMKLLEIALARMQMKGPNATMSGNDPREQSGRAILAQQAGGAAQNEPLADGLREFSREIYEIAWQSARQYWTAGKMIRVTDDMNETRWIGVNQPVRLMDELAQMPQEQRAMTMQRMQLMPGDPRLQQVIRVENEISDLEIDISVAEGIDVPAQAAEDFATLVQLTSLQPGLIPGDVLIAASSLRGKDDLLQRMKAHMEAQQQEKQQQAPLVKAHAEATVAGLQAKAAADAALAKERQVAAVSGVHAMHSEFAAPPYGQPYAAPPDAPSAPGSVEPNMPPEMQALHDHAALRAAHAKALLDEIKARHEAHKIAQTIAATHQVHENITNPPKPAPRA